MALQHDRSRFYTSEVVDKCKTEESRFSFLNKTSEFKGSYCMVTGWQKVGKPNILF